MKNLVAFLLMAIAFQACKNEKNIPDVSKVAISLQTVDFSKDFFALDTAHLDEGIQQLFNKHTNFATDYFFNIIGSEKHPDSVMKKVKQFLVDYRKVNQDANKLYADFSPITKEIAKGFRFIKYYFPKYPLPDTLITYIGPWDAIFMLSNRSGSSSVMQDGNKIGIGLQLFMGKDYGVYQEPGFRNIYPDYISRRFEKNYIPVNVVKQVIDDMYPDQSSGTLIEQMVEAGKRLYLLDAFMPNTPDTLKTGYTAEQLKGCYENEGNIWSLFVNNDLLFTTNPALMKDYMNDAPNTAVLGEKSPGMIGHFTGWQIVKKWMEKHEKTSLEQLMKIPPKQIFEESKYKPK